MDLKGEFTSFHGFIQRFAHDTVLANMNNVGNPDSRFIEKIAYGTGSVVLGVAGAYLLKGQYVAAGITASGAASGLYTGYEMGDAYKKIAAARTEGADTQEQG